jgi:hypothetical protein
MYQFSGQLDNAVAPVDSILASVAFGDPGKFSGKILGVRPESGICPGPLDEWVDT